MPLPRAPVMFFGSGHLEAGKKIFLSVQEVMTQETFDNGFDKRVFKKPNSASARVKTFPGGIKFQAKIRVVPTPDHGMEVIGRAHFIHRGDEQFRLQVRNKLIGSSMHDEHRRFACT